MRLVLDHNFLLNPGRPRFTGASNPNFSPWSFSRRILETGSGYAANGSSTKVPRNVDSFLRVWGPSQQQDLLQQWDNRRLSKLMLLSREQNTELYLKSLFDFGFQCEEDHRSDLATNVYATLKEQSDFPDLQRRAVERLQALQKNGPIGASMGLWLRHLGREAADPWTFLPMWLAGPAFRVTRLGILSRLLPSSTAGFGARGFAAETVAWLGGLAAENSVFTFSARGLREVLGEQPQDWSPLALGRDWVVGGLALGSLRSGGWASGRLYQSLRGAEALSLGVREKLPLSLFQYGGVFGGILLSQQVEMGFGSRPDTSWGARLIDGTAMLVNSHVARHLSPSAFDEPWQRWEQRLEFQLQQLRVRARSGFPGLGSHLGNYGSLAWEAERNSAAPRIESEGMNRARRLGNFMVGDNDHDGAENNGATPEAPPIVKTSTSEHTTSLRDADLLEAQREFFELYPHAASIFTFHPPSSASGEPQWGEILKINPRFAETFGYQPEEVLGRSLLTFLHPEEELSGFETLSSVLLRDGASKLDAVHFQHKDGSSIWCNLAIALKRGSEHTLGFASLEDVSLQRRKHLENAEQYLIAMSRLRLTSQGLAHDSLNALMAFLYRLDLMQQSIQDLGQFASDLSHLHPDPRASEIHTQAVKIFQTLGATHGTVQSQAQWILSLIRDFQELTAERRKGPPFNLHSLLETSDLRSILGDEPELKIHLDSDPWLVPGPQNSVRRVIQNLVGNARDAMIGRPMPSLRIETAKVSLSREDLSRLAAHSRGISSDIAAGDFMRLRISDSGSGMDEATRSRIFEPYFSTKPKDGSGHSGLGLAMTLKLVQDAGGFLTVESVLGEGTTFNGYLPKVQPAKNIPDPAHSDPTQMQRIPSK